MTMPIDRKDKEILRDLATRVAEIGNDPYQAQRREMWKLHNGLRKTKPMVLCFPEGAWGEIMPTSVLQCADGLARGIEHHLRQKIYYWEHLRDDNVIEPWVKVGLAWSQTGWGMEPGYVHSGVDRGAWHFDPPLKDPDDLDKLHFPDLVIDEEATQRNFEAVHDAISDIIEVKTHRRIYIWGEASLVRVLASLRGLDQVMWDMIDRPEWVHKAMSFLRDGMMRFLDQVEAYDKLDVTNTDDYVGSGGVGYTDELPSSGFTGRVRLKDLWGFAEAQELSRISPAMHEEFALQYQRPLLERFGLSCYGCCEPVTDRLEYIFKIPNLRRISVSPWADLGIAAEGLQNKYVFSWKPNPAQMCGNFDPDRIRQNIRETLDIAKGCVLEMILKDTHTVDQDPSRLSTWVRIAQEETGGLD
jgi:hypothetical protein